MSKAGTLLACLVFALAFGAVGAGATWALVGTVRDGLRAADWVRVKATVDAFDRNGGVSYRYTVGGVEYHGDRLGASPLGGTDNLDSWHDDMRRLLSAAMDEKRPITVFVNPENPSQSMVDNTLRWKLVVAMLPFALGFGGVGVGALVVLLRTLTKREEAETPALPRVTRSASSGLGTTWLFTLMWNVISFPIAIIAVPGIIAEGEWVGLLVLLFPIIGVLLLWGAISATIAALKARLRAPRGEGVTLEALQAAAAAPQPGEGATVFARRMISEEPEADAIAPSSAGAATLDADASPAMARKLAQAAVWLPRIVIGAVILWVVFDFGSALFAMLKSFLD